MNDNELIKCSLHELQLQRLKSLKILFSVTKFGLDLRILVPVNVNRLIEEVKYKQDLFEVVIYKHVTPV